MQRENNLFIMYLSIPEKKIYIASGMLLSQILANILYICKLKELKQYVPIYGFLIIKTLCIFALFKKKIKLEDFFHSFLVYNNHVSK